MRLASVVGYLSLAILTLSLAACGGGDTAVESEEASPSTTAPLVAELTTAGEETTTPTGSPDESSSGTPSSEIASDPVAPATYCEPTQSDMLGPYYEPDTPVRTSVDSGYLMSGNVLSAGGCEPIPGTRIEFWLANAEGNYDDAHRATVPTGDGGEYRFESNFPGPYENRPPHIHIRVTAPGHQELVTQHYPEAGQTEATFDLVLQPA